MVRPSFVAGGGGVRSGQAQTLTERDAEALLALGGVAASAPEMSASAQLRYMSKNQNASVVGVTPAYFDVRALSVASGITGTFTTLLGSIAAVSLIVGGIGIMNVMLVSVRERTREIGVRMAVGARRGDILRQFLFEAVAASVAGGAIGVGIGYGAAQLLARFGQWQTIVPSYAIGLALGVSIVIGVAFGVGPARRAARLDPVEALRFE